MTTSKVERVRAAILAVFPSVTRKAVDRDVYAGRDDPGGWAPKAVAVIHCEGGIPNANDFMENLEKWCEVSERLGDLFCEPINGAVIAVYKA